MAPSCTVTGPLSDQLGGLGHGQNARAAEAAGDLVGLEQVQRSALFHDNAGDRRRSVCLFGKDLYRIPFVVRGINSGMFVQSTVFWMVIRGAP